MYSHSERGKRKILPRLEVTRDLERILAIVDNLFSAPSSTFVNFFGNLEPVQADRIDSVAAGRRTSRHVLGHGTLVGNIERSPQGGDGRSGVDGVGQES